MKAGSFSLGRMLRVAALLAICALLWQRRPHSFPIVHPSTPVSSDTPDARVSKTRESIRIGSEIRDYVLARPAMLEPGATYPVLVGFHGYRGEVKALETAPLPVTDGLEPRSKAVPLRFALPLGSLATGRYDCQVTVLDPAGQKVAFWRAPVVLVP